MKRMFLIFGCVLYFSVLVFQLKIAIDTYAEMKSTKSVVLDELYSGNRVDYWKIKFLQDYIDRFPNTSLSEFEDYIRIEKEDLNLDCDAQTTSLDSNYTKLCESEL